VKRKLTDFYLGLFVLAGLAAIGYMIIRFGGGSTRSRYDVTVLFDRVESLIQEAPVYYAGVECGKVRQLIPWGQRVEERPNIPADKVKAILSIDRQTTLRAEDEIKVVSISLLGEKSVEITPGPFEAPALPKDGSAVLVGINPEGLFGPVRELFGPLAEEETQQEIQNIFRSFSDLLFNLNQLTGEELQLPVRDTVQGLSLAVNDFRSVLMEFRAGVRTLTGAGEQAQRLLTENREQIGTLLGSLDETVKSLDRVVDDIYPVIADIKAGRGGLGKLIRDPSWYTNFSKILIAVRTEGILRLEEAFKKEEREARYTPSEPRVWVR
jgi:phospholipid/cholesterol/gamma-HCH transport system substrate-binding protein